MLYVLPLCYFVCLEWFTSTREFGTLDLPVDLEQAKQSQPTVWEDCKGIHIFTSFVEGLYSQSIYGHGTKMETFASAPSTP
jgi:hypothetical protein